MQREYWVSISGYLSDTIHERRRRLRGTYRQGKDVSEQIYKGRHDIP